MNSWVTNEKATIMNNDIITQKHFNTQAVIKWKIIWFFNLDISKEKLFFSFSLLNNRLSDNYLLISIDKLFNLYLTILKKIQMYIYSSFYFLISYICLPISLTHILCIYVYSMINHWAYIQTNKAFSCTHTHDDWPFDHFQYCLMRSTNANI